MLNQKTWFIQARNLSHNFIVLYFDSWCSYYNKVTIRYVCDEKKLWCGVKKNTISDNVSLTLPIRPTDLDYLIMI